MLALMGRCVRWGAYGYGVCWAGSVGLGEVWVVVPWCLQLFCQAPARRPPCRCWPAPVLAG